MMLTEPLLDQLQQLGLRAMVRALERDRGNADAWPCSPGTRSPSARAFAWRSGCAGRACPSKPA